MKKILLIAPQFDEPASALDEKILPLLRAKVFTLPVHLATIAALTPDDIELDIWDEAARGWIDEETKFDKEYDLVGVTSQILTLPRAKEIARICRKRGIPVAIGGTAVSLVPEQCRDDFDILFIGETELTWPQFIVDWKAGIHRQEYRQVTFIDMALSPPPRWDSIEGQMDDYFLGGLQTSYGCPFDCEFCDLPHLFGRKMRHKPIDKVLEEVAALERLGKDNIYIYDSNFIGNPNYTKDLLRELIPLNNSFEQQLRFHCELTINVAHDDELLSLLADANFEMLLIGIESPNKESLKETNKLHNLRSDMIEDCKKVMSYGLQLIGTFVIGFDHDTPEISDQVFEFIQEAYIPFPVINILKAIHGTKLRNRLIKEERLLDVNKGLYDEESFFVKDTRGATNIIPQNMTRAELFSGYLDLIEKVYDWDNFAERIRKFVSNIKRQPNVPQKDDLGEDVSPALNKFLLALDGKAQSAIFSTFLHTRQHAPFMTRKVATLVGRQYIQSSNLPQMREAVTKQIEFEESVDIEKFLERPEIEVISIPANFNEPYQAIFPEIYERVYSGLTDKNRTYEALIEVFTDFIARYGKTFNTFSEHHKESLHEISDCIIAKKNNIPQELSPVFVSGDLEAPKREAAISVLKAVEQELRAEKSVE